MSDFALPGLMTPTTPKFDEKDIATGGLGGMVRLELEGAALTDSFLVRVEDPTKEINYSILISDDVDAATKFAALGFIAVPDPTLIADTPVETDEEPSWSAAIAEEGDPLVVVLSIIFPPGVRKLALFRLTAAEALTSLEWPVSVRG